MCVIFSGEKKDHREQEKQIIMHKDKENGIVMMIKWNFHLEKMFKARRQTTSSFIKKKR